MTRSDLAAATKLSYPYISQLETGTRHASHRAQLAIARALGAGLDDLFNTELRGLSPSRMPEHTLLFEPIDERDAASAAVAASRQSVSKRKTLSEVVAAAVEEIQSLPKAARLEALNQVQKIVVGSLTSSNRIESLEPNEVFVFGSNARGLHDGGAARQALKFGAVWGQGHGRQGQTYAIDTMTDFPTLVKEVETFLDYARQHPELRFLVTPIGTGVAGYRAHQIAPLFVQRLENVVLPAEFIAVLEEQP
ncbi:helix-turn-helix domain-containing protein [Mycobacterium intermedium]|nr:helix-turn-helix domain-containing protein [Mycobacterium intermedium]